MIIRREACLFGTLLLGFVFSTAADAQKSRRNPYMSLSNFTLNGRSNEAMYPREEIALGLTVGNVGAQPTAGGTLIIESIQGPATPMRATIEIPALASGERAELRAPESALRLQVNSAALASETVTVLFKWTTREGFEGSITRDFRIIRGQLTVAGVDFGNASDPEAGGIQPGGEGDIYLTVTNTGNETMRDIEAMPEGMTCATARSGAFRIASLAPGQRLRLPAPVRVAVPANCPNGSAARIALSGEYDGEVMNVPLTSTVQFYSGVMTYFEREIMFSPAIVIPTTGPSDHVGEFMVNVVGYYVDLAVTPNISHTYIGDLVVSIEHPDGTVAMLHNRTGGSADFITQTFGMGGVATPALDPLKRKPSEGLWKLKVHDVCDVDSGQINSLKLRFRGYTTGN